MQLGEDEQAHFEEQLFLGAMSNGLEYLWGEPYEIWSRSESVSARTSPSNNKRKEIPRDLPNRSSIHEGSIIDTPGSSLTIPAAKLTNEDATSFGKIVTKKVLLLGTTKKPPI